MYHGNVVELRYKKQVKLIYQLFAFYHNYVFDSTCFGDRAILKYCYWLTIAYTTVNLLHPVFIRILL